MKRAVWFVVIALGTAACSRSQSSVPASAADSWPPELNPEIARMPLADRLAREAAGRSQVRPRGEDVLAAFRTRGFPVVRSRQVLASPLGAQFCLAGVTEQGLVLAVCEFGDEASARKGLEFSRRTFDRRIPGRSLHLNGPTLLTITRPEADPAMDQQVQRAVGIFSTL
jgi:hypothetical protein